MTQLGGKVHAVRAWVLCSVCLKSVVLVVVVGVGVVGKLMLLVMSMAVLGLVLRCCFSLRD